MIKLADFIYQIYIIIDILFIIIVRLLYMTIIHFPFLDLYGLAYISIHLVHVIHNFDIYKDSSLFSWYQSKLSDFFFRCFHGLGIITMVYLFFRRTPQFAL